MTEIGYENALPPLPFPLGIVPRDLQRRGFAALRSYGKLTARLRPMPDFLIIGAKRCGTTSLYKAIEKHPDVASMWPRFANIKSPHFFDLRYDHGVDWYRGHFPIPLPGRPGRVVGEADPYCMFHPLVPGRVAATVPGIRLIALLRDPVDRAVSHHWDRVREGIETLSLEDALDAEEERLAGAQEALERGGVDADDAFEHFSYATRGFYAQQIRVWREHFPAAQLLVLRSEDLYRNPQPIYDRVLEHVGLAPYAPEFVRWHTRSDKPPLDPALRGRLAARFSAANQELAALLGQPLWWNAEGPAELERVGAAQPVS
jgi:hypothetical protein